MLDTKAVLLLEDGTSFEGTPFGALGEAFGEVVFNTSMTGYQEILTDPSYKGQIVAMTYPLIGNYGVNAEDGESAKPWLSGFIVREASSIASNWRSSMDLGAYMSMNGVVGIQGVDTRALTRHLRINGAKHGVISSTDIDGTSLAKKLAAAPRILGVDLVREVTCGAPYVWTEPLPWLPAAGGGRAPHVVVLDYGVKRNILRNLVSAGCSVTVVPAGVSASEIMARKPDGLLLSNGPGDPDPLDYAVSAVKALLGKIPMFGICLGHELLGLAMGGRIYKLKFGHHGGNHPVKDLETGRIAITSQNHGFNVEPDSIPGKGNRVTHLNLYDKTAEGMENKDLGVFSVQYHPEAGPGPHDSTPLFRKFVETMKAGGRRRHAQEK
jgi:carbamoyl-phosphate synthase small subunit